MDTILLIIKVITLFNPLRVFLPLSIVNIVMGIGLGTYYVLLGKGVSVGALLFFSTGLLLFCFGLIADQISSLRRELFRR